MAKYWTRTDEYFQIINIMMNDRRWRGLDAAQQKMLHEFAAAAARHIHRSFRARLHREEGAGAPAGAGHRIEPAPGPWREKGAQVLANLKQSGVVPKELADRAAALT